MSTPERGASKREIAHGLLVALRPAIASGAQPLAMALARDVAQLLNLGGLDRLLAACQPHAGRPWPASLGPALERILREAARCEAAGDIEPFRAVDAELAALAAELESIEWNSAGAMAAGVPAIPTLSAADVLGELPLAEEVDVGVLRSLRLTVPVAAALRAALDWLTSGIQPPRPVRVATGEGLLEILCERVDPSGLRPANDVLSEVGASLGPTAATEGDRPPAGGWVVRVPTSSARDVYLMLLQGDLRLALPWHAVLRLAMIPAGEIAARARRAGASAGSAVTVLEPLAPLGAPSGERPVALLALGFKRAYLVADRLVWRLKADPCEAGTSPPVPGLSRAVRTDEGEIYWVAEPAWLLRDVALPELPAARRRDPEPAPRSRPRASASGGAAVPGAPGDQGPREQVPREQVPREQVPREQVPREQIPRGQVPPPVPLRSADVEALPLATPGESPEPPVRAPSRPQDRPRPTASGPAPGPGPTPGSAPRVEPPASSPAPGARRALVAEDSITARIFLGRMLEQHGFEVCLVENASELLREIARDPWSLVCVDIELPDARGPELLRAVAERLEDRSPLVVLVRDREDIAAAGAAGQPRVLRKPFDLEELTALLSRLGIASRGVP